MRPVALLNDAAIPVMLLVLGMQFERHTRPEHPAAVATAVGLSLLVSPLAVTACTRNVVGAHIIGIVFGALGLALFGLFEAPPDLEDVTARRIGAIAVATIGGAATLNSTLAVAGATTLNSTLAVTGATTLNNTLAVTGAATLSDTLAVGGAATIGDVAAIHALLKRFDEIWQASAPAVTANTTGL